MNITIHAGHNPDGKIACGASDYLMESTEARKLVALIKKYLKGTKVNVVDITVNNGKNQNDVLAKLVKKANLWNVHMHVSIHFNASTHDKGDGKTTGTEAYVYNQSGTAFKVATSVTQNLAKLGFKNRGVKDARHPYFLRKTTAPALLIEVCFVTDKDDALLYRANRSKVARAITRAIIQYA